MGAGCKRIFKGGKKSDKTEVPLRRMHKKVNLKDLDKLLLPSSERQSVTHRQNLKAASRPSTFCLQYWTYDCIFNIEEQINTK